MAKWDNLAEGIIKRFPYSRQRPTLLPTHHCHRWKLRLGRCCNFPLHTDHLRSRGVKSRKRLLWEIWGVWMSYVDIAKLCEFDSVPSRKGQSSCFEVFLTLQLYHITLPTWPNSCHQRAGFCWAIAASTAFVTCPKLIRFYIR